ncbi:uncharacterized protein LOC141914086 [Tubulanus polymorphus]|uniref:uncharacterized protein LOC141914086 n=1 Tax=Tubulanus polymorphus TaxID=672921 RepID=UPI003DA5D852
MEIQFEMLLLQISITLFLIIGGVAGKTNKCYSCYYAHYSPENVTREFKELVDSARGMMVNENIYSNRLCATDINRMYNDEPSQSYIMYRCESYEAGGTHCAKQTVKKDDNTYFVVRRCISECTPSESTGPGYTIETKCCNSRPYCNLATDLKRTSRRVLIPAGILTCVSVILWTLRS